MDSRKELVVSTRVRAEERALIRAVAESEGLTVSEAVREILMPAVREHLSMVIESGGSRQ